MSNTYKNFNQQLKTHISNYNTEQNDDEDELSINCLIEDFDIVEQYDKIEKLNTKSQVKTKRKFNTGY